jgi:hypothetical protein
MEGTRFSSAAMGVFGPRGEYTNGGRVGHPVWGGRAPTGQSLRASALTFLGLSRGRDDDDGRAFAACQTPAFAASSLSSPSPMRA